MLVHIFKKKLTEFHILRYCLKNDKILILVKGGICGQKIAQQRQNNLQSVRKWGEQRNSAGKVPRCIVSST